MTLSLGPARLAALETDDSAHSLNWLTHGASSAGPGRVSSRGPGPGPGRAESSTERRVSRRYSRLQVRVKAYTRAGPGLTGTILIWVRAAMAERRAACAHSRHGLGDLSITVPTLPSEWQREPIPHPSFRARAQAPAPVDNGSGGLRPGRGLAVYSDNRRFWWEKRSEGPRHVLNTNWWWRRALWTWLELKYRVLSPLSARRGNFL